MKPILIIIHICICVAMIIIVLVQKGKGAGMGAAFGGSSDTVFGSSGATSLLHKVTTGVAILFMLTSLGLSIYFGKGATSSIMKDVPQTQVPAQVPVSPKNEAPAQPNDVQGK